MIDSTKRELKMIEQSKKNAHKPVEAMSECIDRFFYGSSARREKLLEQRL